MSIKECVICGLLFQNRIARAITCSDECRKNRELRRQRDLKRRKREDKEYAKTLSRKVTEWKRAKRASDPEWAKKVSTQSSAWQKEKRIRNPEWADKQRDKCRFYYNSQSAAASMLEACAAMIQINERGLNHETE